VLAFGLTLAVVMLPVFLDHNWHAFWRDSVRYQATRVTPFSVWGLWGGLGVEQKLVEGAAVALAIAVVFVPRKRGVIEVAALGAAVVILLQCAANYWLYSYIVWFFPFVIVALMGAHPRRREELAAASSRLELAPAPALSPLPASALSP
jgi:hypothetical protein